jgi:tripartite-type tricarboxylate transporter receptor subunit TctC
MDVGLWFVLLAPAATPRDIVTRLNSEAARIGAAADYRAQLDKVGFEPFTGSPEQCSAFMKAEHDRWGKVIRDAGVKAEN